MCISEFFIYIALISTLGVVLCIYDKSAAKRPGTERIRERTLCLCGILGGALSMLLTMLWIRHKTQHSSIMVLMSTASLIWIFVYALVFIFSMF